MNLTSIIRTIIYTCFPLIILMTGFRQDLLAQQQVNSLKDLEKRQKTFLNLMEKDQFQNAFQHIMHGSEFALKKQQRFSKKLQSEIRQRTNKKLKGKEHIGTSKLSNHLAFGLGILRYQKTPVYFFFMWYKPDEDSNWKLDALWFNFDPKTFLKYYKYVADQKGKEPPSNNRNE